jgi:hypothetical protein
MRREKVAVEEGKRREKGEERRNKTIALQSWTNFSYFDLYSTIPVSKIAKLRFFFLVLPVTIS